MPKNVIAVSVVFENCEVLKIKKKDIIILKTGAVCSRFIGNKNSIQRTETLEDVFIAVNKDMIPDDNSNLFDNNHSLRTDVTWIIFHYDDGSSDDYYLEWGDDDNPQNCTNQRMIETSDGHQCWYYNISDPERILPKHFNSVNSVDKLAEMFA